VARQETALWRALSRLADLVDQPDRQAVAELCRRFEERRLRVVVVGEAKRGKSTLINALLGRPVLPSGVVPLTSVATTVRYGEQEAVEVRYLDGRCESVPVTSLPQFVTEPENPDNTRRVADVVVALPVPLLHGGVELVDTPGTGSVHAHNTNDAAAALERMDAALFVVSADPPISDRERAWLHEVRRQSVRVFCVLNKADYLDRQELAQSVEFTRAVVSAESGTPVDVWPVSARTALAAEGDVAAADARWRAFHRAFGTYLRQHGEEDLTLSVATRAARLARAVAEEADVTLTALGLSRAAFNDRMRVFTEQLDRVAESRLESAAIAHATLDRLLAETGSAAAELQRTTSEAVVGQVVASVDASRGSLRETERDALELGADIIRGVVDDWRAGHQARLDGELARLDTALRRRVDEHVNIVRDAAASLSHVDLLPAAPAAELIDTTRFRYAFGPDVGQIDAIAARVRTHLPGRLGRHAVARYVGERIRLLLDRQVGRARADYAERLRETARMLDRELDHRFNTGAGRIAEAVRRAGDYGNEQETVRRKRAEDAASRRRSAARLAADLDRLVTGSVEVGGDDRPA
jgi:small GTP-binding protein